MWRFWLCCLVSCYLLCILTCLWLFCLLVGDLVSLRCWFGVSCFFWVFDVCVAFVRCVACGGFGWFDLLVVIIGWWADCCLFVYVIGCRLVCVVTWFTLTCWCLYGLLWVLLVCDMRFRFDFVCFALRWLSCSGGLLVIGVLVVLLCSILVGLVF